MIRAITQPNYLDNVIDSTANGEIFHISSLSILCEFINDLKVSIKTTNKIFGICSILNQPLFTTCLCASFHYYTIHTQAKRHFCMLDVVFAWLKWMSKCSHIQLPIELQTLYINIFEIQS